MPQQPTEATTSTALAPRPTAGQASIADVRALLIVVGDEGILTFDLATDGRE
jgi:hypothetical protein